MTITDRLPPVLHAQAAIAQSILTAIKKYDLTAIEVVHILNLEAAVHLKFAIADERKEADPVIAIDTSGRLV